MRTLLASPEVESAPYEQVVSNGDDEGGTCVLCKTYFATVSLFKTHYCGRVCTAGHVQDIGLSAWKVRAPKEAVPAGHCRVLGGIGNNELCGAAVTGVPTKQVAAVRRLPCGCEPGWRCQRHASLVKKGQRADPVSEAVVQQVYRNENALTRGFSNSGDLGGTEYRGGGISKSGARTGAGSERAYRNAPAQRSTRQHSSNADRQKAYRERQRAARDS